MPSSHTQSAVLIASIENIIKGIDSKLSHYLKYVGIIQSVDELRDAFNASLSDEEPTPSEKFERLNMQHLTGSVDDDVMVGMILAATAEARYFMADAPIEAFKWLLRAEYSLGYAEGASTSKFLKDRKRKAAMDGAPLAQKFKADLLAYLDEQRPAKGWSGAAAIKAYANQDIEHASAFLQGVKADEWASIDSKIKGYLRSDPDFNQAFQARMNRPGAKRD